MECSCKWNWIAVSFFFFSFIEFVLEHLWVVCGRITLNGEASSSSPSSSWMHDACILIVFLWLLPLGPILSSSKRKKKEIVHVTWSSGPCQTLRFPAKSSHAHKTWHSVQIKDQCFCFFWIRRIVIIMVIITLRMPPEFGRRFCLFFFVFSVSNKTFVCPCRCRRRRQQFTLFAGGKTVFKSSNHHSNNER